jgi:hypothetical protein
MVQLKLGFKAMTQDHIDTTLKQLRDFSSDQNIAIIATDPNGSDPGVTCVTFEFDASDEVYYHALGNACRAWLDDPDSGVVVYAMIRDKPFGGF